MFFLIDKETCLCFIRSKIRQIWNEISGCWNTAMVTHYKFSCTLSPMTYCAFLLMKSVEILEATKILNDPLFLSDIWVSWLTKLSQKKMLRALSPPTCHQLGGQRIRRRSESNDSSDTGRADILEQWLCISTDLGWNQVHGFAAFSKVQLIPLCLGRWEGESFLRSDR